MVTGHAPTIKCVNPSTRQLIGEVPCLGPAEVEAAVQKAATAYESWRLTDFAHRARKLRQLRRVLSGQADQLAAMISSEVGKPLVESYMAELIGPLDACTWFADNTEKALRDQTIELTNPLLYSKQSMVVFEPLGVGGKDAAIVLPDAPPEWTARGIVWGAFTNCGQACASSERLYLVKGKNTEKLIERIVHHAAGLKLGSGLDPDTEIGPLIDEAQLARVVEQVDEAKDAGARVLCG